MMSFAAASRILGLIVGFDYFGIMGMLVGGGISNLVVLSVTWAVMLKLHLLDFKLDLVVLMFIFILSGITAFAI